MTIKINRIKTKDDWLLTDPDVRIEILNGRFVEDHDRHSAFGVVVIDNLYRCIHPFVETYQLGHVFTDGVKYRLKHNANHVIVGRIPDFSFVRRERFSTEFNWSSSLDGAPDLAIEIISTRQTIRKLMGKIVDYLEYGSQEVWLIFSKSRELHRYQKNTMPPRIYRDSDILQGENLFPGLSIAINDIFTIEA